MCFTYNFNIRVYDNNMMFNKKKTEVGQKNDCSYLNQL